MAGADDRSTTAATDAPRRVMGAMPWLKPRQRKHYRAKVFQSGNSLAVRLPSGTALTAGMEMDLTIEDGQFLSMEPIDPPKRKFDIAKVAGSALGLCLIRDEDRLFEERTIFAPEAGDRRGGAT